MSVGQTRARGRVAAGNQIDVESSYCLYCRLLHEICLRHYRRWAHHFRFGRLLYWRTLCDQHRHHQIDRQRHPVAPAGDRFRQAVPQPQRWLHPCGGRCTDARIGDPGAGRAGGQVVRRQKPVQIGEPARRQPVFRPERTFVPPDRGTRRHHQVAHPGRAAGARARDRSQPAWRRRNGRVRSRRRQQRPADPRSDRPRLRHGGGAGRERPGRSSGDVLMARASQRHAVDPRRSAQIHRSLPGARLQLARARQGSHRRDQERGRRASTSRRASRRGCA